VNNPPLLERTEFGKIQTGYGLDDRRIAVRVTVGSKCYLDVVQTDFTPHQAHIQSVPGVLSPGVKLPGRETNHSPSTTAEVKKT
jgi:hypothetical protein